MCRTILPKWSAAQSHANALAREATEELLVLQEQRSSIYFVWIDMTELSTDLILKCLNCHLLAYLFISIVSVGFCRIRDYPEARATEDILVMKVDRCVALILMLQV